MDAVQGFATAIDTSPAVRRVAAVRPDHVPRRKRIGEERITDVLAVEEAGFRREVTGRRGFATTCSWGSTQERHPSSRTRAQLSGGHR